MERDEENITTKYWLMVQEKDISESIIGISKRAIDHQIVFNKCYSFDFDNCIIGSIRC